jgi:hypothetical protein
MTPLASPHTLCESRPASPGLGPRIRPHKATSGRPSTGCGAVAQLGERLVRNEEVGSSILPGSTTRNSAGRNRLIAPHPRRLLRHAGALGRAKAQSVPPKRRGRTLRLSVQDGSRSRNAYIPAVLAIRRQIRPHECRLSTVIVRQGGRPSSHQCFTLERAFATTRRPAFTGPSDSYERGRNPLDATTSNDAPASSSRATVIST